MRRLNRALLAFAERVGVDAALLGDLAERSRVRKSDTWLTRQLVAAVAIAVKEQSVGQPAQLLLAIYVGTIVAWVLRVATMPFVPMFTRHFGITVGNALLAWQLDTLRFGFFTYRLYDLPRVWVTLLIYAAAGYAVRRAVPRAPGLVIVYWVAAQLFWGVSLVERWHDAALIPKMSAYPYISLYSFLFLPVAILLPGLSGKWQRPASASAD